MGQIKNIKLHIVTDIKLERRCNGLLTMNQIVQKMAHPATLTTTRFPILRKLLQEIKHIEQRQNPEAKCAWRLSPLYQYGRSNPQPVEDSSLEHYTTLLKAIRCNKELQEKYKGVGKRSIEDTAKMVGLKMPKLYKDPSDDDIMITPDEKYKT